MRVDFYVLFFLLSCGGVETTFGSEQGELTESETAGVEFVEASEASGFYRIIRSSCIEFTQHCKFINIIIKHVLD